LKGRVVTRRGARASLAIIAFWMRDTQEARLADNNRAVRILACSAGAESAKETKEVSPGGGER
jgi:hypothetical protein